MHLPVLLNTFAKSKYDIRNFQCSLTHFPKANGAYAPSSAPKHICPRQMWRTHLSVLLTHLPKTNVAYTPYSAP